MVAVFSQPFGESWDQVGQLALALGLSSLIGLERELRQRSAGLRTHALVGVGAALIMLVSKYGFTDVLGGRVILDPSRVAAQIVSGIGFIGAGLIFVRRDAVRGLTTAATIWLTAGVGMAAGAGLPILACLATGAHFLVVYCFTPLVHRLEQFKGDVAVHSVLRVNYRDREGVLRRVLALCTQQGFTVTELATDQLRMRNRRSESSPSRYGSAAHNPSRNSSPASPKSPVSSVSQPATPTTPTNQ